MSLLPPAMRLPADAVQLGVKVEELSLPTRTEIDANLARMAQRGFERGDHQPDGTVKRVGPAPGSLEWLLDHLMADLGHFIDAREPRWMLLPQVVRKAMIDSAALQAAPPVVVDGSKLKGDWIQRYLLDERTIEEPAKPKTATEILLKQQAAEKMLRERFCGCTRCRERYVGAGVPQMLAEGARRTATFYPSAPPQVLTVPPGQTPDEARRQALREESDRQLARIGIDPAAPGSDSTVFLEVRGDTRVDAGGVPSMAAAVNRDYEQPWEQTRSKVVVTSDSGPPGG